MADRNKVRALMQLPYYENLFEQMAKPLSEAGMRVTATMLGDDYTDIDALAKANEQTLQFIMDGVMSLTVDIYVEELSDADIDALALIVQDPVMLKLLDLTSQTAPRMVAWFEENAETIERMATEAAEQLQQDA